MTNIREYTLESWPEYDTRVKNRSYRRWIYRGQENATWGLKSSLLRAFETVQEMHRIGKATEKNLSMYNHERVMIERFKSNAHLYLDHVPNADDDFSWLALMQHYGAPSRLLDFSFSPYVAAYFALENGNGDAAIYAVEHSELRGANEVLFEELYMGSHENLEELYKKILKEDESEIQYFLYTFEPKFSNERIMAQQGVFLMPNSLSASHQEILETYGLQNKEIVKYIIPKELRADGVRHLHQMNISANM